MSKSSSLVLGETKVNTGKCRWGRVKHNVTKLCYILSGVGSRVITGGQKWDVMKINCGALFYLGNVTKIE
jgi:hypothetical protein